MRSQALGMGLEGFGLAEAAAVGDSGSERDLGNENVFEFCSILGKAA